MDNKSLWELVYDYKDAETIEEKDEIFDEFLSYVWSSKNNRRHNSSAIKFIVREDLADTEVGKLFKKYERITYTGAKSKVNPYTGNTEWYNLIRQKINNLYTYYFDKEVIFNRDYLAEIKVPRKLYYRWIDGEEMSIEEIEAAINNSLKKAEELKNTYQQQKMELSWFEYKKLINEYLRKIFDNMLTAEDWEEKQEKLNYSPSFFQSYFWVEDNLYIKYISNSLSGYIHNYQKEYYGLKRGRNKQYRRCKECGKLIEKTGNKKMYCDECAAKRKKESNKNSDKKYRDKIRENRKQPA